MKKYGQISLILGIFFALVWWRGHHQDEGTMPVSLPVSSNTTTSTPTTTPSSPAAPPQSTTPTTTGQYKNGRYTGSVADAFYGNVQVEAVISGGKLTDVIFLQHPNDNGTSNRINNQAMPLLKQEALQSQSANVDGVTGASATSGAFIQSLGSALQQAS